MRYYRFLLQKVFLLAVLNVITNSTLGQYPTNAADLLALSRTAKHDTTKAQALLYMAVLLRPTEPDSATVLCTESMRIVDAVLNTGLVLKVKEKRAYRRIKATCILNAGHHAHEHEQPEVAMQRYEMANKKFEQADFILGAHEAMVSMGDLLKEKGATTEGAELIKRAGERYGKPKQFAYGSYGFSPKVVKQNVIAIEPLKEKHDGEVERPPIPIPTKLEDTNLTVLQIADGASAVFAVDSSEVIPRPVQDTLRNDASTSTTLDMLGIDTALITASRVRLAKPVRTDSGVLEARDHFELGEVWDLIKEPELAMNSFQRSLEVYRNVHSDSGECVALLRIGELVGDQGSFEQAFELLDSARHKARTIGRHDLEGLALAGMGDMCRKIEECGGSTELYRRSIELAHAEGDKRTEARGYLGLTEELVERGSLKEAEPLGKKGLDIATDINDADLRQQGAELLQGVYSGLGRAFEARAMGELALRVETYIAERDRVMDSIITAMRAEFGRVREQDSLTQHEVRTALETNLSDERVKVRKSRTTALLIAGAAVFAAVIGVLLYRRDRRRRQVRAERKAMDLEIRALRAQMNPHFLFNALNSINDHIQENEADIASDFLTRFSRLMRHVLEMSRLNEVPLKRELDVLRVYAELERMRLKDRFEFVVEVAADVDQARATVPPLILQPFVENAIWHGLSRKEGAGTLRITVVQVGETLRIGIEDNGVGRHTNASTNEGHGSLGTSITKERLDLWSAQRGAPAGFVYTPVPVGTRVELQLPMGGT